MASTINAISTGAGGLATTADASGILQIQTNGTTAITVDASQVVSLTHTLPISSGGTGLTVVGNAGNILTSNGITWVSSTPSASLLNTAITPGTSGNVLTSDGTSWVSSTPAGANIPLVNVANSFTNTQTLAGSASTLGAILTNTAEVCTVSATAATGTIVFYPSTQSVLYYTTAASANWTINLTFSSGTTMNTAMSNAQVITLAHLVTQSGTAYYNNVVQVDGTTSGVTTIWQGGVPTKGNAAGVDVYTYTIIKTGSATFTVLVSQTQFKG